MSDPSLYALVHGPGDEAAPANKNHFQEALESHIKKRVDQVIAEEDPSQTHLMTKQEQRKKLEYELFQETDSLKLQQHIAKAVTLLISEGGKFLIQKEYEDLMADLKNMRQKLKNFDFDHLDHKSLKAALFITPESFSSIAKVAICKYEEGSLLESLSILVLLSALGNEKPDYWYKEALVAEECGDYDLAAIAFDHAEHLIPDYIGIHIFAAECAIQRNQFGKAKEELIAAKEILNHLDEKQEWQQSILDVENLLHFATSH